jgi:hypothetical protein
MASEQTDLKAEDKSPDGEQPAGWRNLIRVHAAAELLPLMEPEDLRALGEDIEANGLQMPIALLCDDTADPQVLDGCSRLDAMA